MGLLTTAYLLDRFGPFLTYDDLAKVLHMGVGTLRNRRSANRLEIPGVFHGGKVLFHAEDVATYIERLRQQATRT